MCNQEATGSIPVSSTKIFQSVGRTGRSVKRFLLLVLATVAGYVAVMSVLIAAILGSEIYDQHEWGLLPITPGSFVGVFVSCLIALLAVWGHIATLRRVRRSLSSTPT